MRFFQVILLLTPIISCAKKDEEKSLSAISKIKYKDIKPFTGFEPDDYISAIYQRDTIRTNGFYNHVRSKRVDDLLKNPGIKHEKREEGFPYQEFNELSKSVMNSLTAKELLYYCVYFPRLYRQNCSPMVKPPDNKIYIHKWIPDAGDLRVMSPMQEKALKNRKKQMHPVIASYLEKADTIELECLETILFCQMTDAVPMLCKKIDSKVNPYIYTVFYQFMIRAGYEPFMQSQLNNNVFEKPGALGEIELTEQDAKELTQMATEFYTALKK